MNSSKIMKMMPAFLLTLAIILIACGTGMALRADRAEPVISSTEAGTVTTAQESTATTEITATTPATADSAAVSVSENSTAGTTVASTDQGTTKKAEKESSSSAEKTTKKKSGKKSSSPQQSSTKAASAAPATPAETPKTPAQTQATKTTTEEKSGYCTVTIQCKSILDNMDKLKEGHEEYVPKNGILLPATKYAFSGGDTVYDVVAKACKEHGIRLNVRNTIYGKYIAGINGLDEFDVSAQSGWMYKVNGAVPMTSASSKKLHDGDKIEFYYTCEK